MVKFLMTAFLAAAMAETSARVLTGALNSQVTTVSSPTERALRTYQATNGAKAEDAEALPEEAEAGAKEGAEEAKRREERQRDKNNWWNNAVANGQEKYREAEGSTRDYMSRADRQAIEDYTKNKRSATEKWLGKVIANPKLNPGSLCETQSSNECPTGPVSHCKTIKDSNDKKICVPKYQCSGSVEESGYCEGKEWKKCEDMERPNGDLNANDDYQDQRVFCKSSGACYFGGNARKPCVSDDPEAKERAEDAQGSRRKEILA